MAWNYSKSMAMTRDEYNALPGINFSSVKHGTTSLPRMHVALSGESVKEQTSSMSLGSLFHSAMEVGSVAFASGVVCKPDGIDRRTKAGKDAWSAFIGLNHGKTILETETQMQSFGLAVQMAQHVEGTDFYKRIASKSSLREVVFQSKDEQRKGIVDWLVTDSNGKPLLIVDWKSAVDASPRGFVKAIARYGYAQQAAWYQDLVADATGVRVPFVFVAVESSKPFSVGIYTVADFQLETARALNELTLRAYRDWLKNDEQRRNNHTNEPLELLVPAWAFESLSSSVVEVESEDGNETPF